MKALLMKDYWILFRNCKQMLIVPLLFLVLFAVTGEWIWSMWPVFFVGVIPYTIMSYEEQSNWPLCAETMPYGRKMIVYEKYTLLLINGIVLTALLSGVTVLIQLIRHGSSIEILWEMMVIYAAGTLLPGTIMLPIVFKYGVTKGRTVYLMILVVFGGLMGAMGSMSRETNFTQILQHGPALNLTLVFLIVLILFVLSAAWSIRIYKNRDL